MGEFNISQDEQATHQILGSAPKGSYIRLATGYFNLTEKYANTLLKDCKANISLLMAHPNVSLTTEYLKQYNFIFRTLSLICFWNQTDWSSNACF